MPDKVIVHIAGKDALNSAIAAGKSFYEAITDIGSKFEVYSETVLWDEVPLHGIARRYYLSLRSPIGISDLPQNECRQCCHFLSHPPRCRFSKRSISPKQFACKKYSPKHNPR